MAKKRPPNISNTTFALILIYVATTILVTSLLLIFLCAK